MIYGRVDELLYLHGAKATQFAKAMAPGLPVCLTVTVLDGIVVGRSAFHMSMNYRSAVIHGHASLVTDGDEAVRRWRPLPIMLCWAAGPKCAPCWIRRLRQPPFSA